MKICAPFAGIVHYKVAAGDRVETGQELASVEAIKLEAPLLAPGPGVVDELHVADFSDVIGGDALITLRKA
ncbi:acetyl-CoA carboxylase biotin carboxyl carrier protein subunit [Corynebacterium sp. 35RC1]|nr:acetyl-CoA carboxylase biotin carboxyl carrier protein subunit [Corynebacterium sp. 35RC1]